MWLSRFSKAILVIAAATTPVRAEEDPAKEILRSMSDWLASQQTLAFSFDSAIEVITPELEKIQFPSSGKAVLARPDRLRAHRISGHAEVELVFNNGKLGVRDVLNNAYAQVEAPEKIDALIDLLHSGYGVAMPGSDLLLANPYDTLIDGVAEAKYLGEGVIGGRICHHLAFREADIDWQLWVETGDRPAPCRMIITSKTMTAAPAYTLTITAIEGGVSIEDGAFNFTPPEGSTELDPNGLIHLDELPAPAE